jgi:TRAP-type C4-dicarboxylate transport system substrate-binding protein
MSWADAQPALASGAVDAQENPLEVFLAAKIHTLGQKYVTKWNYCNDILLFAIADADLAQLEPPPTRRSCASGDQDAAASRWRWCASCSTKT